MAAFHLVVALLAALLSTALLSPLVGWWVAVGVPVAASLAVVVVGVVVTPVRSEEVEIDLNREVDGMVAALRSVLPPPAKAPAADTRDGVRKAG